MNKEAAWDKLLQIQTCGRDDTNADQYHHPYLSHTLYIVSTIRTRLLPGPFSVVSHKYCPHYFTSKKTDNPKRIWYTFCKDIPSCPIYCQSAETR